MLLGFGIVRDEADIIEAMVRHNLGYVDHLHFIDNGSSDRTPDILDALAHETGGLAERTALPGSLGTAEAVHQDVEPNEGARPPSR